MTGMYPTKIMNGQLVPEVKIKLVILRLDEAGLAVITTQDNVIHGRPGI